MDSVDEATQSHDRSDRPGRRRPFSTWVKKLANFKSGSSSTEASRHGKPKRGGTHLKIHAKRPAKLNNPYPQSGRVGGAVLRPDSVETASTARSGRPSSTASLDPSASSIRSSVDERAPPTAGERSMAPTVSTDHEATHSIMASSAAGTSRTAAGGLESRRGGDSTFSSPAPSVRSLTTTLTTIQSMAAPNGHIGAGGTNYSHTHGISHHHHGNGNFNSQSLHFNQPFPTSTTATSPSAPAIPSHLAPSSLLYLHNHPTTYSSATANNLLTDNASILTLASSSKRRRRRGSIDTDASVRAIPPSSLWGGSRESLPLSVLSATIELGGGAGAGGSGVSGMPTTPGLHQSSSRISAAAAAAERTSVYSANGITITQSPLTGGSGDGNSIYSKQNIGGAAATTAADAASVRSGLYGHGRADSINGSIGGGGVVGSGGAVGISSPLVSPREDEAAERDGEAEKEKGGNSLKRSGPARD